MQMAILLNINDKNIVNDICNGCSNGYGLVIISKLNELSNIRNEDKKKIIEFMSIPAIRDSIMNKNSLYYKFLISSVHSFFPNYNSFPDDYGSVDRLFSYKSCSLVDYNYDYERMTEGMVNYFKKDNLKYIYYYDDNDCFAYTSRVLFENSLGEMLYRYNIVNDEISSWDYSKEELKLYEDKYKYLLNMSFREMAIQAVLQNKNIKYYNDDDEYWEYLFGIAESNKPLRKIKS